MTTMRWFSTRGTPRGVPGSRRALPRRPVVLLTLALVALGQAGCCQYPTCNGCGPVATTWRNLRQTVARPFQRMHTTVVGSGTCCGTELGTEAPPIQYGTPAIVTPVRPGTVTAPGATETAPSLEAIPEAKPGPPPTGSESTPSQGAKQGPGKTSYEAARPRFGDEKNRASTLARTTTPSPAPTDRSAQGSSPSSEKDTNPLDNLPPLDLPKDVARADSGTPPAPPAPERKPTASPGPVVESTPPLPAQTPEPTAAPGIRRFAGVESKLAGGSLPSVTGLDWLAEKGYKTILDLREEKEISTAFIADVARRGLRYTALPITENHVDANHIARFEAEIALADGRPLYFCDTDGTRAGVMWYLHRLLVDKVDTEVARRDAEELGLADKKFWAAAQGYLDSLKPHPVAPPETTPAKPPAPATPAPAAPAPKAGAPATPKAADAPVPAGASLQNRADVTPPSLPVDPNAWRPLVAMLVTGLGLPLAYVSRNAITPTIRALAKASLPGPARTPRSLPGASGG